MADKLRVLGTQPVRVRDDDRLEAHVQEMDISLQAAINQLLNDRLQTEFEVWPAGTEQGVGEANSDDVDAGSAKGLVIFVNITAVQGTFAGGEGFKLYLKARDKNGVDYPIDVAPTRTTTGRGVLVWYPGVGDTAEWLWASRRYVVPKKFFLTVNVSGSDTPKFTFGVTGILVP